MLQPVQKRIEDRFSEVEKLIKEKRITPENRSIAESEIQLEKEKIGNDIEAINKENPAGAEQAKTTLESSINERLEQIDTQIEASKDIDSIESDLSSAETSLENLDKDINIDQVNNPDTPATDQAPPDASSTLDTATTEATTGTEPQATESTDTVKADDAVVSPDTKDTTPAPTTVGQTKTPTPATPTDLKVKSNIAQ